MFFKVQPLVNHTLKKTIQNECILNKISGTEPRDATVTHSPRGSLAAFFSWDWSGGFVYNIANWLQSKENCSDLLGSAGDVGLNQQDVLFPKVSS